MACLNSDQHSKLLPSLVRPVMAMVSMYFVVCDVRKALRALRTLVKDAKSMKDVIQGGGNVIYIHGTYIGYHSYR
jgi:hypothetical protein